MRRKFFKLSKNLLKILPVVKSNNSDLDAIKTSVQGQIAPYQTSINVTACID